ncbi:MAG: hypothetical protein HGA45_42595, partial [Chloroflexales bacterium]|nr:hypothetical protein [Chloroflexales bacterium]
MKLGITATQVGLSGAQAGVISTLLAALKPDEVHHGDCLGGDAEIHALARVHTSARIVAHPGHIEAKRANCQVDERREPAPTLERNITIIAETDLLLAAVGCE